jgi:glycopeptide antibiotics resistance protein
LELHSYSSTHSMDVKIKATASILFSLYFTILLKLILFKGTLAQLARHFTQYYSWTLIKQKAHSMNTIPFTTIYYYLSGQDTTGTIPNMLGNILIFIPFGFLLPILNTKYERLKNTLAMAFLTSITFEVVQLIIAYGTFDIDDCILNTIGAAIGFLTFKFWRSRFFPLPTEKRNVT